MKKLNPRRQPATRADVERAKKQAMHDATGLALAIMFTVLRDKRGYTVEDLQQTWREVERLSESVNAGYVSVADLAHALKAEAGIEFVD